MEPSASLTNTVREPLAVIRPGNFIPPISQPAGNLVCNQEVSEILSQFPPVEFLPIVFSKIVDFWIKAGDMSYYQNKQTREVDGVEYLKRLPDARGHFSGVAHLWELLAPELTVVEREFDDLRDVDFYFGDADCGDDEEFAISSALFEKYSIVESMNVFLFRSDVFDKVAQYFDEDFFCLCTREID